MEFFEKHIKYFKLALPVLAFTLYANTIPNDYNLDDELVTRNHPVTSKGLKAIPEIISSFYYEDAQGYKYDYRPVAHLSFALEHQFFGENPQVSHFINVLLYSLAIFVFFSFLYRLFPQRLALLAWIASVIFLFHPMHTEVVASIKNRDEILAFLFAFISGIILLKAIESKGKIWYIIPGTALFILAILAKVSVVSLAFLIPVSIYLFKDMKLWQWLLFSIPLVAFSLLSTFLPLKEKIGFLLLAILLFFFLWGLKTNWLWIRTVLSHLQQGFRNAVSLAMDSTRSNLRKIRDKLFQHNEKLKLQLQKIEVNAPLLFTEKAIINNQLLGSNKVLIPLSVLAALTFLVCGYFEFHDISKLAFVVLIFSLLFLKNKTSASAFTIVALTGLSIPVSIYLAYDDYFAKAAFSIVLSFLLFKHPLKTKILLATITFLAILLAFFTLSPFPAIVLLPILVILILVVSTSFVPIKYFQKAVLFVFVLVGIGFVSDSLVLLFGSSFELSLIGSIIVLLISVGIVFIRSNFSFGFISIFIFHYAFVIAASVVFPNLELKPRDIVIENETIPNTPSAVVAKDTSDLWQDKLNNFLETEYIGFVDLSDEDRELAYVEVPVSPLSPFEERLGTALHIIKFYTKNLLTPYQMGYYYGYAFIIPHSLNETSSIIILACLALVLIFSLIAIIKRWHIIAIGVFFLVVPLFQVSTLFFPIAGMVGDRYLFFPSIGFSILLAYPIFIIIQKGKQKVGLGVMSLILLSYAFITIQRNFQWKDKITLFEHDINYLQKSAVAHALLAAVYLENAADHSLTDAEFVQVVEKGANAYKKAINIYPDFLNYHYYLGVAQESIGKYTEALASYQRAIALDSNFSNDPYYRMGRIYFFQSDYAKSAENLEMAVFLNYQNAEVYNTLFVCYMNLGQLDKGKDALLRGLEIYPNDFYIHLNLIRVYYELGKLEQSKYHYNRIAPSNPQNQDVLQLKELLGL